MSLYTKYRPRDWNSVVGQDTISTILKSALKLNQVGHAYIFTGSRGTGKTTSARILAKGVNCENLQDGNPCHTCANCVAFDNGSMLDIIEIDGASTNGVDDVRELIEKARFEPNQGKFKVYIIDEVHMLSTGAFNALLKTLEEPPEHVKFILATTEIEKVPETIRSRSLRFDFRKITEGDIIGRLEYVIKAEGIKATPESLAIIAKAARGGMRDALTLLEQHTINSEISTEYVMTSLALLEDSLIEEIIAALREKNIEKTLNILDTLKNRHVQVRGLFDQILYTLRDLMLESINSLLFHEYESIFTIFESAYGKIRVIPDGQLLIEITLIRAVKRGEISENKGGNISQINVEKKNIGGNSKIIIPKEGITSTQDEKLPNRDSQLGKEEEKIDHESTNKTIDTLTAKSMEEKKENGTSSFSFITLLNALKSTKPALVVDLKNAQFEVQDTKLKLSFQKEWNFNRVNSPDTKNLLTETLANQFGGSWIVECALGKGTIDITDGVF